MQTRTPAFRKLILPVGFALVCAVLTFFVWHAFGGRAPLQAEGYRVTIPLPTASNLFPGADVRIAGVNVGKVREVERARNHADVVVELKPDFVPLRRRASAILRTKTLLGEAYVAISPGPASAPAIADGGRMAPDQVRAQQRLDDVLETFAPGTRRELRSLFAGLADAFDGRSADVNATLGDLPTFAQNLDAVASTLDAQRPQLRQLIANGGDVLQAVGDRDEDLHRAITASAEVLTATGERDRALAATLRALPGFATTLTGAARTLDGASGDLTRAVTALRPAARRLDPALASIDKAAPTFRTLFTRLTPTLAAGTAGLPATKRLVAAASPALDEAYPTARQLIPLLQLLSASRRSVVGTFANVGQIQNGTMIGPGGKVIHYGNGLPTIWNEIVGGWVKRLPTNRQNPYPKPDSALDIGLGGLKAFDCRNIHNTLYLSAIGSAPPCVEQGQWTFNGAKRTFPHLEEAPK